MAKVLQGYGLAAPDAREAGDLAALLLRLEENAPVEFTALAERADFVKLIESIAGSDGWERLRAALAEGAVSDFGGEATETASGSPAEPRPLEDLHILWVDDQYERNQDLMNRILKLGATLAIAKTTAEVNERLESIGFEVLISDVSRDGNPEAGFDAVAALRERGNALPVVFFTGRKSSARMDRALDLRASLTTEPDELIAILERQQRAKEEFTAASPASS